MDVKIYPTRLDGVLDAPSSKAMAHRVFIASAFSDKETEIYVKSVSQEVLTTIECLKKLGATITKNQNGYLVSPIQAVLSSNVVLDVKDSAPTLRFLLPIVCALGMSVKFKGGEKLSSKKIKEFSYAIDGCVFSSEVLPVVVSGQMRGNVFNVTKGMSSQFISGLAFAVALLHRDATINFVDGTLDMPYFDMTLNTLTVYGVRVIRENGKFIFLKNDKFISPSKIEVEGDYTNASYFLGANVIGNRIRVLGLNPLSMQGDKNITDMLLKITSKGSTIDVTNYPDLVAILAVCSCYSYSTTTLKGISNKSKERERLNALVVNINKLGGRASITDDSIIIDGTDGLKGGVFVDSFSDHRIAMAMAVAATMANEPVTILTAQAVKKAYPNFFNDFVLLGGKIEVM